MLSGECGERDGGGACAASGASTVVRVRITTGARALAPPRACLDCRLPPKSVARARGSSVLRTLHGLQQDGYTCIGLAERGTWWVAGDGRVKTGCTVRFDRGGSAHPLGGGGSPAREERLAGRAEDLRAVADLFERMADTSGCKELPSREAFETEMRAVQLRLSVLQAEHAALCAAQAVNVSARPERRGAGRGASRLLAIEPEIAEHNRRLALLRQQMRQADEFMLLFPLSFFACGRSRRFVAACRAADGEGGAVQLAATLALVLRHRAIEVYADLSEETLLRWIRLGGTSEGGGSKLAKTLYERDEEVFQAMDSGAFGAAAARGGTPPDAHAPTAVERQSRSDLRRMFDRFATRIPAGAPGGSGKSEEAIFPEGFSRMVRESFPHLRCSPRELAEGFTLADARGAGRLDFATFAEWWDELRVSDALGLQRRWQLRLRDEEETETPMQKKRAAASARLWAAAVWRRWRAGMAASQRHGRVLRLSSELRRARALRKCMRIWSADQRSADGVGPGYEGGTRGRRVAVADGLPTRRVWGAPDRLGGPWLGGPAFVGRDRGLRLTSCGARMSSPCGTVVRSVKVLPPPGNYAGDFARLGGATPRRLLRS